ncbi:hypothetical protein TREMEDRAFT_59470 [Tremella mesenterica DSM 1558]|uniref:uncharacterized protein n=1 Tax=Tremella mesenterica (strain ATCC 24925 / CBS 8224 / DSM 1558 / NBRC 9311 / NRRL Y-6157 / RJB 2259-6 / UBC 559-6) TaxID=578456 RepID=UPI0003F497E7|nr:uncharacterized protein TREMEDRAFT_59470 [Tremella mesenterica DSM 1558]EIW73305.1 hypothetical protein TREMEDRAFT_59470 [Tremella mesenterica DSM 1558]
MSYISKGVKVLIRIPAKGQCEVGVEGCKDGNSRIWGYESGQGWRGLIMRGRKAYTLAPQVFSRPLVTQRGKKYDDFMMDDRITCSVVKGRSEQEPMYRNQRNRLYLVGTEQRLEAPRLIGSYNGQIKRMMRVKCIEMTTDGLSVLFLVGLWIDRLSRRSGIGKDEARYPERPKIRRRIDKGQRPMYSKLDEWGNGV